MTVNKSGVVYRIGDACISCGKCYEKCPVKAIEFKDSIFRYDIGQDVCIKCGTCHRGCVYNSITKEEIKSE